MTGDRFRRSGAATGRFQAPPAAACGVRPSSGPLLPVEDILQRASEAAALAQQLMAMPRRPRLAAARHEPRFHRLPLLTLLSSEAQDALLAAAVGDRDGQAEVEVAAILAATLPADGRGRVHRAGALAHWLLGKARLRQGDLAGATAAFQQIGAIPFDPREPVEEAALGPAGLAQVAQAAGDEDEAVRHFQIAALAFAEAGARLPTAACLAEAGLQQAALGHQLAARRNLDRAWRLFEQMPAELSPATAARVALAAAECDARLRETASRHGFHWLARAHRLYDLPAPPHEAVRRAWMEALVAVATEHHDAAEVILRGVRARLLAEGSLAEAVTATCDTLHARYQAHRPLGIDDLAAALEESFPQGGAPWAAALRDLAACAVKYEGLYPGVAREILRRLAAPKPLAGRPDLLVSQRALTDRLLLHVGELEDPSGAPSEIARPRRQPTRKRP